MGRAVEIAHGGKHQTAKPGSVCNFAELLGDFVNSAPRNREFSGSGKEISWVFSNLNPIVIIFVKMILRRLWCVLLFLTQRSQSYEELYLLQLNRKPELDRHRQQPPRWSLLRACDVPLLGQRLKL